VAVTSCIGKKAGIPKTDGVITGRELAQMLRLREINFHTLNDIEFDQVGLLILYWELYRGGLNLSIS
jgi:iron only hydrogenase large subunit-like protein